MDASVSGYRGLCNALIIEMREVFLHFFGSKETKKRKLP